MNGAMQGLATTQASTPVMKSPAGPLREAAGVPPKPAPRVNTPDRLRPTANIRYTSAATNQGCCNWKPQPAAIPAARSATTSAPTAAKAASTPAVYQSACARARWRLSPLWARPSTLSERIGSTQGIRFRSRPPSSASSRIPARCGAGAAGGGPAVRCALSAEASGRAAAPAGLPAMPGSAGPDPASVAASVPSAVAAGDPVAGRVAAASTLPAGRSTGTRRVIGG